MSKTSATARVTFIVDMPADGSWGDTCQVDQIFRQAGPETMSKLQGLIRKHGGRIVGEPKVTAMFVERDAPPPPPTPPFRRAKTRADGFPTRNDTLMMSPAELAIADAMHMVERAGASVALTEAVIFLGKARDRVADHVEDE